MTSSETPGLPSGVDLCGHCFSLVFVLTLARDWIISPLLTLCYLAKRSGGKRRILLLCFIWASALSRCLVLQGQVCWQGVPQEAGDIQGPLTVQWNVYLIFFLFVSKYIIALHLACCTGVHLSVRVVRGESSSVTQKHRKWSQGHVCGVLLCVQVQVFTLSYFFGLPAWLAFWNSTQEFWELGVLSALHPWETPLNWQNPAPGTSCSPYCKGWMRSALGREAKQETQWWDGGRRDSRSMTHSTIANNKNCWRNHIIRYHGIKQAYHTYSESTSRSTKKLFDWAKEGFSFRGLGAIVILKQGEFLMSSLDHLPHFHGFVAKGTITGFS